MSRRRTPIPMAAPRSARRGITLVEMLVTIATLVVVLGLALAISGETDHATRRILRHQTALQYCQQAMDQVLGDLRAAVDPTAFSGLQNQTILATHLRERELELLTHDPQGGALTRVSLRQVRQDDENELTREASTIAETAGDRPVQQRGMRLGGPRPEYFSPSIRFKYAAAAQPGKTPDYVNEWTQPGLPALIQVTIEARFDDERDGVLSLQSAEIPGLLAARLPVDAATAAELATPIPAAPEPPAESEPTTVSTTGPTPTPGAALAPTTDSGLTAAPALAGATTATTQSITAEPEAVPGGDGEGIQP